VRGVIRGLSARVSADRLHDSFMGKSPLVMGAQALRLTGSPYRLETEREEDGQAAGQGVDKRVGSWTITRLLPLVDPCATCHQVMPQA
jgi:hypothetical protein